jgi:transcriptional regulator with XRE-family HTH domain
VSELRLRRLILGLTTRQLARELDISEATLSLIERREMHPGAAVEAKLQAYFKRDALQLLQRVDPDRLLAVL